MNTVNEWIRSGLVALDSRWDVFRTHDDREYQALFLTLYDGVCDQPSFYNIKTDQSELSSKLTLYLKWIVKDMDRYFW